MLFVCHSHVNRMYSYVTRICHLYVLVCHPYVIRMYSYVIRISLKCTLMSSVCHSYVVLSWTYISSNSLNENCSSKWTIRKHLSWSLFILLLFARLWWHFQRTISGWYSYIHENFPIFKTAHRPPPPTCPCPAVSKTRPPPWPGRPILNEPPLSKWYSTN